MKSIVIIMLVAVCVQCALSAKSSVKKKRSQRKPDVESFIPSPLQEDTIIDLESNNDDTIENSFEIKASPTMFPATIEETNSRTSNAQKPKRSVRRRKNKNIRLKSTPAVDAKNNELKTSTTDTIIEGDGSTGVIKRNGEIIEGIIDDDLKEGIISINITGKRMFINDHLVFDKLPLKSGAICKTTFVNPPKVARQPAKFKIQIYEDGKIQYSDNMNTQEYLEITENDGEEEPITSQNQKTTAIPKEQNKAKSEDSTGKDNVNSSSPSSFINIEGDGTTGDIKRDGKTVIRNNSDLKDGNVSINITGNRMFINNLLISDQLPLKSGARCMKTFMNPPAVTTKPTTFKIQISKDGKKIRYSDNEGNNENLEILENDDDNDTTSDLVVQNKEEEEPKKDLIIQGDARNGEIKRDGEVIVQNDELLKKDMVRIRISGNSIYINNHLISNKLPLKPDAYCRKTFITPDFDGYKPIKFEININKDGKIKYTDNAGHYVDLKIQYKAISMALWSEMEKDETKSKQQSNQEDSKIQSIIDGEDGSIKLDGKVVVLDEEEFKNHNTVCIRVSSSAIYINGTLIATDFPISPEFKRQPHHKVVCPPGKITKFKIQIRTDYKLQYSDNSGKTLTIKI